MRSSGAAPLERGTHNEHLSQKHPFSTATPSSTDTVWTVILFLDGCLFWTATLSGRSLPLLGGYLFRAVTFFGRLPFRRLPLRRYHFWIVTFSTVGFGTATRTIPGRLPFLDCCLFRKVVFLDGYLFRTITFFGRYLFDGYFLDGYYYWTVTFSGRLPLSGRTLFLGGFLF